jgi:hypothetical protein
MQAAHADPPLNSSVTLDFGGFEAVLFNTPGEENATINNIPPHLNRDEISHQKNSIKLNFDEDSSKDALRLAKKRVFGDSTIQLPDSSAEEAEESSEEQSSSEQVSVAPAQVQDCKIVLKLSDDDISLAPPVSKKQKKEPVVASLPPPKTESFFKS